MKTMKNKGFTLAELLIVMAIIVVLAAIAIPTFAKQLETARESSDVDAIRAAASEAFSECYTKYITDSDVAPGTRYYSTLYTVKFTQHETDFQYMTPVIEIGNGKEDTNGQVTVTDTPVTASLAASNGALPGTVFLQFQFTVGTTDQSGAFYLTNIFAGPSQTAEYDSAFAVPSGGTAPTGTTIFTDSLITT